MPKLIVDAGTTWTKLFELFEVNEDFSLNPLLIDFSFNLENYQFKDINENMILGNIYIFPSREINKLSIDFDAATGHMAKSKIKAEGKYENEIIALACGSKKLINNLDDATIIDIGSRDIKWIKFKDGKYKDLDWNGACGSATGATLEMLCKFYNINPLNLVENKDKIPLTCGVFGMEKIMDLIANGAQPSDAIAMFIHGLAFNTWNFAKNPEKIYLSGGFCENECFIKSLSFYCEVIKLGRFALLEGLY
ncbi:MAG: BadF/BadG/BcrA/BcrD ATPase family protein [bacterium]